VSFILDSSVALCWGFEDERTPAPAAPLDRVGETGAVAPQHWPLEALNGLMMAERCNRVDAAHRRWLVRFLSDLPIMLDPDTSKEVWTATQDLAERYRLRVYDAAYLELALRQRLPLASLDGPLRAAGTATGVALLGAEP
jgi:predicted nucleic acid-binding protein